MSVIVADIGGTHTRFGLWQDGRLDLCEKLKTAEFKTIPESIAAYQKKHGAEGVKDFAFATAANPFADGTWRFTNLADRGFSINDITGAGFRVLAAEDDFSATAAGCLSLKADDKNIIAVQKGEGRTSDPKVVLGPGTGLGMGYGLPNADGSYRVQKAYGGHMLFTPLTDLHVDIARRIQVKRNLDRPVIFEDIGCGSSFPALYEVCCDITGTKPAAHFFDDTAHPAFVMALDMFHETVGLFAHLCVVTLHGFGGVIMNGGFLDALIERKLWDAEKFLNAFHQKGVPIVTEDILKTPVSIVTDTYISLIGVGKMIDA
jgi:glucokinase